MMLEKLSLSHQELINNHLKELNYAISEYSFANLYLFRSIHQHEVFINPKNKLFIKGIIRNDCSYYIPLIPVETISYEEVLSLLDQVDYLFPLPEESLKWFDPNIYTSTYNRDDSDYIYDSNILSSYPGRHLDGKRNQVTQFLKNNNCEIFHLEGSRINDALTVLNQWKEDQDPSKGEMDYFPCKGALELMEELNLHGIIAYINEEPSAFLIGEELNSTTYAIHFAKANKRITGLYQYLYQTYAQSIREKYSRINLEQDLGVSGLRRSKESYLPIEIRHKYRVKLKRAELGSELPSKS